MVINASILIKFATKTFFDQLAKYKENHSSIQPILKPFKCKYTLANKRAWKVANIRFYNARKKFHNWILLSKKSNWK